MGAGYSFVDIDFYLRHVSNGMRVLDAGCGTGRVSIELALRRKDCVIDAIDNSQAMLDVFRDKLKDGRPRLKSPVRIFEMDMSAMKLDGLYDLIMFPFQSFQALAGREDQLKTLKDAKSLLRENGRIIVSVFDPTFRFVSAQPINFLQEISRLENGLLIVKMQKDARIDYKTKTYRYSEHVLVFDSSRVQVDEVIDQFHIAYHTQDNLLGLFQEAGLEVLNKYSDYRMTRLKDGEQAFDMIFVLG